jgi:uncharacterized protein YigE (DUF2233 family)
MKDNIKKRSYLILITFLLIMLCFFGFARAKHNNFTSKKELFQFSKASIRSEEYNIVKVLPKNIKSIKFYFKDEKGQKYITFTALNESLQKQSKRLVFATNGGIFSRERNPMGLYIENGKKYSKIDKRNGGGNFHLKPNGIFFIKNGKAVVCNTNAYRNSNDVVYALQSGPALVMNNKINSKFYPKSKNINIRNGVGITSSGAVIFAISNKPVSLYEFSSLFKNQLKCKNALYLDGAISQMYVPNQIENFPGRFCVIIGIAAE